MRYYCTHFDINYIAHSLSLYHSLVTNGGDFTLFMFCMDDRSMDHLQKMNLSNAVLLSYTQLEAAIPGLAIAKSNRTHVEYFYTCSPASCYYVLQNFEKVDLITYLDADLFFYSSPEPLFAELQEASIGIIEHRFHWLAKRNSVYGIFNVGWINFRKDKDGMNCLVDWMNDCIEWCYQRLEDDKYADQKYLDKWPEQYKDVKILYHKGGNLAVWNIGNYKLTLRGNDIFVDNDKLIFYHFASLKQVDEKIFTSDMSRVLVRTTRIIREKIYIPYIHSLLMYQVAHIIAKKQTYNNKLSYKIKQSYRIISQLLFPDKITIV